MLHGFLFIFAFQIQVVLGNVSEFLAIVLHEHLQGKLIYIVRQVQHLVALAQHRVRLGQQSDLLRRVATGIINGILPLGHTVHILFQGNHTLPGRGSEQQQVFQVVLLGAVVGIHAEFQLHAKGLKECLVLLPLILQHAGQLILDLAVNGLGNDLQLMIVLEHLTGDVQAQVCTVNEPAHKAKVIRQQIRALLHNQHTVGV